MQKGEVKDVNSEDKRLTNTEFEALLVADNQNLRHELNNLKEEIEKLKGEGADK